MIRKMRVEDIINIVALENDIFHETLGETYLYNEIKENPFAQYFVYEEETQIIGYIGMHLIDQTADIMNFLIKAEYQNKGYGSKLLNHFFKVCQDNHVQTITLEVRETNTKAQSFYKKHQFVYSHRRKNYYKNEDALVFIKEV